MKLLCLADLHTSSFEQIEFIKNIPLNEFDMVVTLGDISLFALSKISEYFSDKKRIVGILGNHDEYLFLENSGIENIHKKIITENDIRFLGFEGSFKYKKTRMPSFTQAESLVQLSSLEYADIIISHTSPYGIHEIDEDIHVGLIGISNYIEAQRPVYNLHGHQHVNSKTIMENGTTVYSMYGIVILDVMNGETQILN